MAVDTAAKRSSAINVGSPWRARLPFPDGTISGADRQVVVFLYSGIVTFIPAGLLTVAISDQALYHCILSEAIRPL